MVARSLEDGLFTGRNQFSRRTSSGHFHVFTRYTEGAVLFNFKWREAAQAYDKVATGVGRVSSMTRSEESARTRERSDWQRRTAEALRKNGNSHFLAEDGWLWRKLQYHIFGKHNGGRCGASSAFCLSFCATRRERNALCGVRTTSAA